MSRKRAIAATVGTLVLASAAIFLRDREPARIEAPPAMTAPAQQALIAAAAAPCFKYTRLDNVPAGTTSLSVRSDGVRKTPVDLVRSGSTWMFRVPTDCVRAERVLRVAFIGSKCPDPDNGGAIGPCWHEWSEASVEKKVTVR